MTIRMLLGAFAIMVAATPAQAIVGQTSTGTGGDTRYLAQETQYSGVVGILVQSSETRSWRCSGALLADRRSILTAAHCVSDGTAWRPISTTVYFDTGAPPDANIFTDEVAGNVELSVSDYSVHPDYSGKRSTRTTSRS